MIDWMDQAVCTANNWRYLLPPEKLILCNGCPAMYECRDWGDIMEKGLPQNWLFDILGGERPTERASRRRKTRDTDEEQ